MFLGFFFGKVFCWRVVFLWEFFGFGNVVFKGIIVLLLVVAGGCGIGKVGGGSRGVIVDGYTYWTCC